jgi:hypothetical protein
LGFAFAIAAAVLAGGCATQGPRGFYAKSLSPAQSAEMAEDTARQMAALYPPASTYLSMKQPAQDPFGTALVGKLRGKGYALAEALASKNPSKAAVMATVGVDFGYVVDGLGADNSYRVTATVGQETLSRAYLASNNRLSATGYWVRRRM